VDEVIGKGDEMAPACHKNTLKPQPASDKFISLAAK
jgi:hypothetical protein